MEMMETSAAGPGTAGCLTSTRLSSDDLLVESVSSAARMSRQLGSFWVFLRTSWLRHTGFQMVGGDGPQLLSVLMSLMLKLSSPDVSWWRCDSDQDMFLVAGSGVSSQSADFSSDLHE